MCASSPPLSTANNGRSAPTVVRAALFGGGMEPHPTGTGLMPVKEGVGVPR